jgi:hypothetical protein
MTSKELTKKIGKHYGYVSDMAATVGLHDTLEKHGMKAEHYASNKKRQSGEATLPEGTDKSFDFVKAKKNNLNFLTNRNR